MGSRKESRGSGQRIKRLDEYTTCGFIRTIGCCNVCLIFIPRSLELLTCRTHSPSIASTWVFQYVDPGTRANALRLRYQESEWSGKGPVPTLEIGSAKRLSAFLKSNKDRECAARVDRGHGPAKKPQLDTRFELKEKWTYPDHEKAIL